MCKVYSSISFATLQLPCFKVLHQLFYKQNGLTPAGLPRFVKVIPLNIYELLTPSSLAYWIMGDGSKQNNGIHLSVYAYTLAECDLLVEALNRKFNINCTLHKHNKGPRIYLDKASTLLVRDLVKPYFVPSMYYKLGL